MNSTRSITYNDSQGYFFENQDSILYDLETMILGSIGVTLLLLSLLFCTLSSFTWLACRKKKWLFSSIGFFCVTLFIVALRVFLSSYYQDDIIGML